MAQVIIITVMGTGAVGKSALTVRFVNDHFVERYDPTIEDSYRKMITFRGKEVMLEVADTAGQEEYSALQHQYMTMADAILLVGSIDQKASVQRIEVLHQKIVAVCSEQGDSPMPVVIVCNKIDMRLDNTAPRAVRRINQVRPFMGAAAAGADAASMRDRLYAFAERKGRSYVETSAKIGTNVDEAFLIALEHIDAQCGGGPLTKRRGRERATADVSKKKSSSGCTMI